MVPNRRIVNLDNDQKKKLNPLLISFFGRVFWDLWLQKLFRNIASVKYQWLLFLYTPVIYGMFDGSWVGEGETLQWVSKISPVTGLAFLGGGFVTLAISRLVAKTSLVEHNDSDGIEFDTDKSPKPVFTDDSIDCDKERIM